MTTFCKVVTCEEGALTTRTARLDTKDAGEAMAPAPGSVASGGSAPGAGAAPVFLAPLALVLALALPGCDGDPSPPDEPLAADPPVALTAAGDAGPAPSRAVARAYWSAHLEAQLGGDLDTARRGYEEVLARADEDAYAGARAAVQLAELAALEGNRRRALELLALAQNLAPDDAAVIDAADALSARLAATPAGQSDVRGPAPGTPLPGLTDAQQAAWREAERELVDAHRLRMKPALETLSASVLRKQRAIERTVRGYRAIAEAGGVAAVAAEFRIGTLYHDLAIELVGFDPPPELEARAAGGIRRSLRATAVTHLRRAVAAYERALAEAESGPDDDPWRVATEAALRVARELLAGAER